VITLGIDPGTARTGFGLVLGDDDVTAGAYGIIETSATESMPKRLARLFAEIGELMDAYRPTALAIEELFFARNISTAMTVGQARGVVLLAAAIRGISVAEYKPAEVKQAVVGYGNADKRQVQEMVRIVLKLDTVPYPDDAADALAVALCHVQTSNFLRHLPEFSP